MIKVYISFGYKFYKIKFKKKLIILINLFDRVWFYETASKENFQI